ncbi:MAG: hypothetical protein ACTSXG_03415 [Alphaproteobacteria bacterium]
MKIIFSLLTFLITFLLFQKSYTMQIIVLKDNSPKKTTWKTIEPMQIPLSCVNLEYEGYKGPLFFHLSKLQITDKNFYGKLVLEDIIINVSLDTNIKTKAALLLTPEALSNIYLQNPQENEGYLVSYILYQLYASISDEKTKEVSFLKEAKKIISDYIGIDCSKISQETIIKESAESQKFGNKRLLEILMNGYFNTSEMTLFIKHVDKSISALEIYPTERLLIQPFIELLYFSSKDFLKIDNKPNIAELDLYPEGTIDRLEKKITQINANNFFLGKQFKLIEEQDEVVIKIGELFLYMSGKASDTRKYISLTDSIDSINASLEKTYKDALEHREHSASKNCIKA